jgi:peroxiredoxin
MTLQIRTPGNALALGSKAPAFELPGVDGRTHSLDDYADADALVLVQSCNHCPYVIAWEPRMAAIQRDYADRGVRLVAVSSNDAERYPADSFEEMQRRAQERQFPFDYLYDEDQSLARALASERTPEVFLFDRDRRLVYHGAIDDNREEGGVTQPWLREALDAVLEGRDPQVAETPPVGCSVKYRQG